MVTISGKHEKPRASPSIAKYGHHFVDCVRQTRHYCQTKRKAGETVAECAQGICHYHMRYGSCNIGGHLKHQSESRRAQPGKAYLARLHKREQARRRD